MNSFGYGTDYQERMNLVATYIHDHLDDELDLLKLAEVACLSPFHWHRIYHAFHGETIAATVKRLRLHRAAGYLVNSEMTVEEIAKKSGYGSLQSFTRIFKGVYGRPPAQYRYHGSHTQYQPVTRKGSSIMHDVSVKTVPAMKVAAMDHLGSYLAIDKAFGALAGWLGARNLISPQTRIFGIFYDDPDAVPEDKLRSKACFSVEGPIPDEPPVAATEIAGGRYAVLRHKGPYADMKVSYAWLYGDWLLKSGEKAADAPCFEEYLNDPRKTPPTELLTDIYLPLK